MRRLWFCCFTNCKFLNRLYLHVCQCRYGQSSQGRPGRSWHLFRLLHLENWIRQGSFQTQRIIISLFPFVGKMFELLSRHSSDDDSRPAASSIISSFPSRFSFFSLSKFEFFWFCLSLLAATEHLVLKMLTFFAMMHEDWAAEITTGRRDTLSYTSFLLWSRAILRYLTPFTSVSVFSPYLIFLPSSASLADEIPVTH